MTFFEEFPAEKFTDEVNELIQRQQQVPVYKIDTMLSIAANNFEGYDLSIISSRGNALAALVQQSSNDFTMEISIERH